ncbi:hypothetical protein EXIGLDRAFT_769429 [Exidia glandulosa HHB12029]|uniref:CCHC-type domain-containing protein n=1 Tax=Exidia glandulosa HHB12029 TaxID=1314781 RepID=A0A165HGF8_EXIGL|nr:hypothetical protein EXIGLDRAFT_769429 [Exidia glandulosa HHB12029]
MCSGSISLILSPRPRRLHVVTTARFRDFRDLDTLATHRFVTPADQIGPAHLARLQQATPNTNDRTQIRDEPPHMQATTNIPASFTGESKSKAADFLRDFKKYTALTAAPLTRAQRKKMLANAFAPFVQEDTPAWTWWQALTPEQREDWEQIEALFNVEWTRPRAAQLELSERMALFRAKILTRDELETRIPVSGTRDTRWRHSEYAEELEALGNRTGVQADLLVLEALNLLPPGVRRIMRKWSDQQQGAADWSDFCEHLGQLSKTAIDFEQESFDAQTLQTQALQETSALLAQQEEEIKKLKRAVADRSPSPMRGRGWGRGLPAYASREPSPASRRWGENEQVAVNPNAVSYRRPIPQTPQTPRVPPQTPNTASPASPRATSTPAGAQTPRAPGTITCFRCGEDGHKVYSCTSTTPLPPQEQEALVASVLRRRQASPAFSPNATPTPAGRRYWPPPTPGTPSPAERPRHVYYLDEEYDQYEDADGDDYEAQLALAHVAFYGDEEGKGNADWWNSVWRPENDSYAELAPRRLTGGLSASARTPARGVSSDFSYTVDPELNTSLFSYSCEVPFPLLHIKSNGSHTTTPFRHGIVLKGKKACLCATATVDGGGMINVLDLSFWVSMRDLLGELMPSRARARIADGTVIPSRGRWVGEVTLGAVRARGGFEVLDSHGSFEVLLGKPWLAAAELCHDFAADELRSADGLIRIPNVSAPERTPVPNAPTAPCEPTPPAPPEPATPPPPPPLCDSAAEPAPHSPSVSPHSSPQAYALWGV